jgi:hypothetical protein
MPKGYFIGITVFEIGLKTPLKYLSKTFHANTTV